MQLPLDIKLPDSATFANLVRGDNGEAIDHVRQSLDRRGHDGAAVYVWGPPGSGKSHLLQAACQHVTTTGGASVYLPLTLTETVAAEALVPAMLEGLEALALVCVDDIDAVTADTAWETALFHLYNRMQASGGCLMVAGHAAPADLPLRLADLRSRLAGGWIFRLQVLADEDKKRALQLRAGTRGFVVPDEVSDYLLRYYPRDMHALFALLDRLDTASVIAQRRLTVPFVKSILEG
jgi:DnaA family protein